MQESPDRFLSGLLSCSLPLLGLFEGLGLEFFTEAELAVRLMGLETSGGMFFCKADDVFGGGLKVDCDFCFDASALPWEELLGATSTLLKAFLSVSALGFLPCSWSRVAASSAPGKELVEVALCNLGMGILTGSNRILWLILKLLPLSLSPEVIPPGLKLS